MTPFRRQTAAGKTSLERQIDATDAQIARLVDRPALREWIDDMEDLLELRDAKRAEGNVANRRLEEIAKELRL